ncbi:MAG: hypothetical protein R2795_17705 [Saprospiraceae bacterium]
MRITALPDKGADLNPASNHRALADGVSTPASAFAEASNLQSINVLVVEAIKKQRHG